MLSIQEFIKDNNYNIDSLYIDKFWESISNDKWIYINDNMLEWIGYSNTDIYNAKKNYIKLLNNHFINNQDYKHINNNEFKLISIELMSSIEINSLNSHNKTKHIILSANCFRESLMLIQTNKAKEIRKYYIKIEELFKDYLKYQTNFQKLENEKNLQLLNKTKNELDEKTKELSTFIKIKKNSIQMLEKTNSIYIATSPLNVKSSIFKIGKSNSLKCRLSNFNVNSLTDNEFYFAYIHKCYSSETLEKLCHSLLKPFNYKKEMFQLNFKPLSKLVKMICKDYDILCEKINNYIKNDYDNDLLLKTDIPEKISMKIYDRLNNLNENYDESINNIDNLSDIEDDNNIDNLSDIEDDNNIDSLSDIEDDNQYINKYNLELEKNEFIEELEEKRENNINYDVMITDNIYNYKGLNLFVCPICKNFISKTRITLKNHINKKKCNIIDFNNIDDNFILNLIQIQKINLLECNKCYKLFIDNTKLQRHLDNMIDCTAKNKIDTIIELKKNDNQLIDPYKDNKIIIDNILMYKCLKCGNLFKTKQAYVSHSKKKIPCETIFKCDNCVKQFYNKDLYDKHIKKNNCKDIIFQCEICNKILSSQKNLNKHVYNIHF